MSFYSRTKLKNGTARKKTLVNIEIQIKHCMENWLASFKIDTCTPEDKREFKILKHIILTFHDTYIEEAALTEYSNLTEAFKQRKDIVDEIIETTENEIDEETDEILKSTLKNKIIHLKELKVLLRDIVLGRVKHEQYKRKVIADKKRKAEKRMEMIRNKYDCQTWRKMQEMGKLLNPFLKKEAANRRQNQTGSTSNIAETQT